MTEAVVTPQNAVAPHIPFLLASMEVALSANRVSQAIDLPTLRHQVPGHLADLYQAIEDLLEMADQIDPEITQAMAAGLRSTHDLHQGVELLNFTLEQTA